MPQVDSNHSMRQSTLLYCQESILSFHHKVELQVFYLERAEGSFSVIVQLD